MKVRFDFVTNSSSSSFVTFGIISPELQEFIQELDYEGYCTKGHSSFGTIKGYEVGEELDLNDQVINYTRDLSQMYDVPESLEIYKIEEGFEYPDNYREKDQKKMLKAKYALSAIKGFFSNLPNEKEKRLETLISEAFKNKNIGCKVYVDYSDGFSGETVGSVDILKQNGLLIFSKDMSFENMELDFFEKKKMDPQEISFKGKTVGMAVVSGLLSNDEYNKYYRNYGSAFDIARKVIEYLGGKVTESVSSITDYVVISKRMRRIPSNSLDIEESRYDSYCQTQTQYKNFMIDGDKKRSKKNKPEIKVIFEEDFHSWIKDQFDELKQSTNIFPPYGVIEIRTRTSDDIKRRIATVFKFQSEFFIDISEQQLKESAVKLKSLGEFISNVERFTKEGAFATSGTSNNEYESLLQYDRQYRIEDYEELKFIYRTANNDTKIIVENDPGYDIVRTDKNEILNKWLIKDKLMVALREKNRSVKVICNTPDVQEDLQICLPVLERIVNDINEIIAGKVHIEGEPEIREGGFCVFISPNNDCLDMWEERI